jgi:acyl transferase domain-containing protein
MQVDAIRETDIAIVGLALRVPGARDADQFWQNLRDGVESIETRTSEQLLAAGESAANLARKHYVPRTAILPDMDRFDADFFGMARDNQSETPATIRMRRFARVS